MSSNFLIAKLKLELNVIGSGCSQPHKNSTLNDLLHKYTPILNENLPKHIVIVMDGNGRWAKQRNKPRVAGHKAGVEATREVVQLAAKQGVEVLSLFAFSSENWHRPGSEVSFLMDLFLKALAREVRQLHKNNIRISFIGELTRFNDKLQASMQESEQLTAANTGMQLNIAVNYGGRWDITQACRKMAELVQNQQIQTTDIDEASLAQHLCMADLPEPDLFIRTSGEQRISNFFLWQLAYTELYFTDTYWPDFREESFNEALQAYAQRKRRFGKTEEQVE